MGEGSGEGMPQPSPRVDPVWVLQEDFNEARAEAHPRDAVLRVLSAERRGSCAEAVDAAGFIGDLLGGLRKDPWRMLGLPRGCTDSDVKKAYRKLALRLHPDKARTETTDLFACLHAAYENLATAEARDAFEKRLIVEESLVRKAKAAGPRAAEELERKFRRERRRREAEQFRQWREHQRGTLSQWERADCAFGNQHRAADDFERRRLRQDQSRKKRDAEREAKSLKKKSAHKKEVSRKIQAKFLKEEAEARMRLAELDRETQRLQNLRNGAVEGGAGIPAAPTSKHPASSSSRRKQRASSASGKGDCAPPAPPKRADHAEDRGPGTGASLAPEDAVLTVVFETAGPMGFTLLDRRAGIRSVSVPADRRDATDWSTAVLRLESEDPGVPGAAESLGVEEGDILVSVNGQSLIQSSFTEVCTVLGSSAHPRVLSFQRRCRHHRLPHVG